MEFHHHKDSIKEEARSTLKNISAYIKIARFDHWIKQLFILPGFWPAFIMAGTKETAYYRRFFFRPKIVMDILNYS